MLQMACRSVSDSQSLRPLSPGARAASPRKKGTRCCGKCAKRIFHNTYYLRRAPQARASDRDGNQTLTKGAELHRLEMEYCCWSNLDTVSIGKCMPFDALPLIEQPIQTFCILNQPGSILPANPCMHA